MVYTACMASLPTKSAAAKPVANWLGAHPELQAALQAAQTSRQMQDRLDLCFLPWVPAGSLRLNQLIDGQMTLVAHSPALIAKCRNNEASLVRSLQQCGLNVSKIRFRVQVAASQTIAPASKKSLKPPLSAAAREALSTLRALTRPKPD
jgi:hypothetical protein